MIQPIGLSGMGRIGRSFLRALVERAESPVTVCGNDLASVDQIAYLIGNDSTRGRCDVERVGGGEIRCGNVSIVHVQSSEPPLWSEHDVRLVVEATGRRVSAQASQVHFDKGADRVLISAPADAADRTIVMGFNHSEITPGDRVLSAASCTTNCLVPVISAIHEVFGVESALLSTVHSYTSDQVLLDSPHRDLRRGRSAATNIVLTTTGAARAVGLVVPELAGRCDGRSFRVPIPDVSVVDLTVLLDEPADSGAINEVLVAAASRSDVMDAVSAPLVSSDILGRPASSTVDLDMTQVVGRLAKIVAWYDNEWGYANRLVDLVRLLNVA